MGTPVEEASQAGFASLQQGRSGSPSRSHDDEGTTVGEESVRHGSPPPHQSHRSRLNVLTDNANNNAEDALRSLQSPSRTREEAHRLGDDLMLLKIERQTSRKSEERDLNRSRSAPRSSSRRDEAADDFDISTTPAHEKAAIYKPPENPTTNVAKIFKKIHNSVFIVRWAFYIAPLTLIFLIPLLLGGLLFKQASVGGVHLDWFCIWLEIVWLSLWAGRLLAKCLPWLIGVVASIFTNNSKKWRDMGKQLEMPATLFFWGLAFEISFLPTMKNHHVDGNTATKPWEESMNKVLISFLVGLILNFVEKVIIQLIAISFHLRTYADRIDVNKFQIHCLIQLYEFSKQKIDVPDEEFEEKAGPASGTRTPAQVIRDAQRTTMHGFKVVGDVAGKIAGDFTGKAVTSSTHPRQVILTLLWTTEGSQVLARRLYRTFAREDTETVHQDDLRPAFTNDEEADAAFTMFDKDMNGDISMEELEAVCVEIGRERKSITASLKDLDSVVSKLDKVFVFIVALVTLLVLISLISTSAAGVLTSAGSTVLALSWLFSATAQEFLQSIVFVFVKHPFDVGDRVSIYGNTGPQLKGDDYFVKEISLLYTEFKKMEGHIVQAPNSYLNTLFILNQRRSGGLAEGVPIVIKFGTTLEQIDSLRRALEEFVLSEKREYQPKVLTELRDVTEAYSLTLNVVFFYKSNWQNEGLRLQRRNKFICAMMVAMQELGIEGPRMRIPGQKESSPFYLQHVSNNGVLNAPASTELPGVPEEPQDPPFVEPLERVGSVRRNTSVRRRPRGESIAQMSRRVDFSLGMSGYTASDIAGDVYDDQPPRPRLPTSLSPTREEPSSDPSAPTRTSTSAHRSGSVLSRLHGAASSPSAEAPPHRRLTRVGTDSTLARNRSNHRNRFFSRYRSQDDAAAVEDALNMESGLAGLPGSAAVRERMDPRSGLISPAAWRPSIEEKDERGVDAADGGKGPGE